MKKLTTILFTLFAMLMLASCCMEVGPEDITTPPAQENPKDISEDNCQEPRTKYPSKDYNLMTGVYYDNGKRILVKGFVWRKVFDAACQNKNGTYWPNYWEIWESHDNGCTWVWDDWGCTAL